MADVAGLRLYDFLRHNAHHSPDSAAIRIDGVMATHKQLDELVALAVRCLGMLVLPGQRVGILLPNSIAWVASFLALNALGAVAVPLSTRLKAQEVSDILGDAGAALLILSGDFRSRNRRAEMVELYAGSGAAPGIVDVGVQEGCPHWQLVVEARNTTAFAGEVAHDVAAIQYTSGTTSRPKGVQLTNLAFVRTALFVGRCQEVRRTSNFFSAAPFFHCSGTMHALAVSLTSGCCLNSFSAWDPEFFVDEVSRHAGDASHGIFFRDLLDMPAARKSRVSTLRVGHALGTPEFLGRVHDELGIKGISNIYGMSETCGQFAMWSLDDPLEKRLYGNGRCQPGNEIRIAGNDGTPCEAGVQGEIQMRGATITPGYFGMPESERARYFTPDGWLRSGDVGYLTETQELFFVARAKDIIRVGGENFAAAEVEEQIRVLLGAGDVAVLGIADARLGEIPVAVLSHRGALLARDIQARLRGRIADYKIPRAFYWCETLPRTTTNKIQKAELKSWLAAASLKEMP